MTTNTASVCVCVCVCVCVQQLCSVSVRNSIHRHRVGTSLTQVLDAVPTTCPVLLTQCGKHSH